MTVNHRRALLPLTVLAAAVALSGCGTVLDAVVGDDAPPAPRAEPGGEVTASAEADVFTLQVGDCLNYMDQSEADQISSLPTVPCSEPHDSEIYAEMTITEDQLPTVETLADAFCLEQFTTFVGMSYDESALYYSYLVPSELSFDQGDDVVQCLVVQQEGGVTGTLKDAGI
ncbi:septum formation family protein [Cellulomonas telluris]|uniref:septum formation family protein n=1 Tax=Cellulomonas telluris TaxID=2306636 RepID=UPI0010A80748|nr:septum formation family protein [Cellulomonas telluris]